MNAVAPAAASELRTRGRAFYLWMAAGYVIVAFGGFVPTYWAKLAAGTFEGPPILHLHGLMMFSWVSFYFFQSWLVATGRTANHRNWGLVGISLFTLLMCSILVGQTVIAKIAAAQGFGEGALRFSAVTLCAWPMLAGFFIAAIANIHRPEVHKRWMIVLLTALMTPAIARVFITLLAPAGAAAGAPPPPFVSLPPALVADLFLVVAIVRDWRVLGRPHPVYLWGGAVLLAQQVLTVPFASTATWMSVAHAFQRLAG